MLRVVFLLCLFVAATCAVVSPADNLDDVPEKYKFPGFVVLRGVYKFEDVGDSSSCPAKPWTEAQTKARVRKITLKFDPPFAEPPLVIYTITQLDMCSKHNIRYKLDLVSVTKANAVFTYAVWCNTYCNSAKVTFWAQGVPGKPSSKNSAASLTTVATEVNPSQFSFT